jgi:hypothetical protein
MSPINMDLSVQKPPAPPMCLKIKNYRYESQILYLAKLDANGKTISTLNLQLAKDCYADMESLPVLYVFYMTDMNTKI